MQALEDYPSGNGESSLMGCHWVMTPIQDGHVTVTFLGGTLASCLVPLALVLYFFFFSSEEPGLEK